MVQTRYVRSQIINSIKATFSDDSNTICAFWWESNKNWGDALNPIIIRLLSGKEPILMNESSFNLRQRPVYAVIGSILDIIGASNRLIKNTIVWGPGFISESSKLSATPKKINAVRGPLTRSLLLNQGINCPEVYGDPALLYPKFYNPEIKSTHKLGIIPHYVDKRNNFINDAVNYPEIKIIDIESSINNVVDQICSCKYIASSSLHGVIAADAYGIPSTWIKLSEGVGGNDFKFWDYFASVGRTDEEPLLIKNKTTIDTILNSFHNYKIDIDLDMLLESCPFHNGK
ncbi:MAG: polysaccharide pyruvyl transferase family protein [Dehalobacter sp.]|nr:polysaccharide pyruvyl transferase family protein [Dehalobacter sp.]